MEILCNDRSRAKFGQLFLKYSNLVEVDFIYAGNGMNQTHLIMRKDKLDGWMEGFWTVWLLTCKDFAGSVGWCLESELPSSLLVSRTGLDDAGLGDLLSVQGLGFSPAPWNLFVGFIVRGRTIGVYYCFSFTQVPLLNHFQLILRNFPVKRIFYNFCTFIFLTIFILSVSV